jgi:hypothetical protein
MRKLVPLVACLLLAISAPAQIEQYEKALENNPRDPMVHFRMGEFFLGEKKYAKAANSFRLAIQGESPADWLVEAARRQLEMINELTNSNDYIPPAPLPQTAATLQGAYTEEARLAGLEGIVIVSGLLTEGKTLQDMNVDRTLGLGLDEKALEAVSQWRSMDQSLEAGTPLRVTVEFTLPEKRSRWHLTGVEFGNPADATRPLFSRVPYPIGSGIAREAVDQGRFVIAVGRSAAAKVAFDISPQGRPSNFRILGQSEETWGPQAIGLLRQWEFQPGTKDGIPVTVPCVITLVWGERSIPATALGTAYTRPPDTVSGFQRLPSQ